jgi:acetolactate synthase-1/2/3 large subunit
MKAAELFARCLEAEGVEYIFGLPGEENNDLLLALQDSSIRVILTRHEQGAAFMADLYGRLTGRPGVCLSTLGPGATNLTTGVADANMDHAPCVVITGQADIERQHKESHQHMNVVHMFQAITKWSAPILHPDNVPEVVRKAFKIAVEEKPGACHIELAEDIARLETNLRPIPSRAVHEPAPDADTVEAAIALIHEAKRPIILAGNGVLRKPAASAQLRRFVGAAGIGVLTTFMGKGCVDRDDPHCLFTIGLQALDFNQCAIEAADLVITIGYDLVEFPPRRWNPLGAKRILHIDYLPAEVDEHYQTELELVGHIGHALRMMADHFEGGAPAFDIRQHRVIRDHLLAEFAQYKDDATEGTIRPQKVLWDVRQALGPSDILLSDVGAHKLWIGRYYACNEPNTCLITNGFCSMGFALPGALAAKLVYPDRKVLAICGDGGFLMNVQELETATRIGVAPVIMIWEDGGYGLVSWKQDQEYGRHAPMSFGNPDFVKLAEAFGWNGHRVENAAELAGTIDRAFQSGEPSIIAVPIDYRENVLLTERLGRVVCPI